jgi:hypothetical protein
MLLEDAIILIKRLIESGEKHQDYKHTVDLAESYKIFITGKGIDKKLIRYVPREDDALFEQRCRLTKAITPAVSSSIRQPFNKVTRNDRIKKKIELENKDRQQIVADMIARFYGSRRTKNRGLEYWLKTRFVELQFIDPNSWVVVEWDAPTTAAQKVAPRPFEVNASQAHNFFIDNDEVKWLLVCQSIKYNSVTPAASGGTGSTNATVPLDPAAASVQPTKKAGVRFTLYDEDVTVVYEQIDTAYLKASGYKLAPNEAIEKVKDTSYIARTFEPNIGYVPAFRIGYKRDEETSARTFVNPWHDALCYFEKSLKTVSELDLTMTLHVFPQKLQYVQKCKGQMASDGKPRRACNGGYVQGTQNEICPICKGNGYKLHTTAQDAILLPMPDDPKDMANLENALVYKGPDVSLVKVQNDYSLQLEKQAHQAVFNSQVFVKKAGGGITDSGTATEADFNMQSVYDALEPFTEKYSEMWREFVTIFGVISGEALEKIKVSHDFPADYKLKTSDILLAERKTASESGAPPFYIETVDDDLASITYAGDETGLNKYKVKRRYFPFSGKNENEVALLLASEFVPKAPKILYSNFDLIFRELEQENAGFWDMTNIAGQQKLVEAKVKQWQDKLEGEAPAATAPMFRIPGTGDGSTGDGNPGNSNTGANTDQNAA